MLTINEQGMIVNAKVQSKRSMQIERTPMTEVKGIIVHQTGADRAQNTFNSYGHAKANGAHFLIDHNGSIYQTASLFKRTNHVGNLRARCLAEYSCKAAVFTKSKENPESSMVKRMHKIEMQKSAPARYPSNNDSIGIEIVGTAFLPPGKAAPANATIEQQKAYFDQNAVYKNVSVAQNSALQWLVSELEQTLSIPTNEVFRHPVVSRKNPSEAGSAVWQ